MCAVRAYEGVRGNLHRRESRALAEIILAGGAEAIAVLLESGDDDYERDLRAAILRTAEILRRHRGGKRKMRGGV